MNTHTSTSLLMTTILCFGDSWTHGNSVALTNILRAQGHSNIKVVSEDFWGSTAEYFAQRSHLLPEAVTKYKPDYVLLSLGGNDYKNIYMRQKRYIAPWKAVAEVESNMHIVLDALYDKHPTTKVVAYGYDFLGDIGGIVSGSYWGGDQSSTTSTTKFLLFLYNNLGVRFINSSLMRIGGMYERLSKHYTKKNNHSLTYVPLWGTLQHGEIKEGEKKISYKMGSPSPNEYMDDPIHANYKGFSLLMNRLYQSYFKPEFLLSPSLSSSTSSSSSPSLKVVPVPQVGVMA